VDASARRRRPDRRAAGRDRAAVGAEPGVRRLADALRSDIRDHWDDGDWRFVCYTAEHGETEGLAVFAIPLGQYEPEAVRVAIVDEDTGATLYRPEPASA
jgi:hypothetical protein